MKDQTCVGIKKKKNLFRWNTQHKQQNQLREDLRQLMQNTKHVLNFLFFKGVARDGNRKCKKEDKTGATRKEKQNMNASQDLFLSLSLRHLRKEQHTHKARLSIFTGNCFISTPSSSHTSKRDFKARQKGLLNASS